MIGQFAKGRVAVCIDAANVFYSQKSLGWNVDYEKLATYLNSETTLAGLYYYTGKIGSLEKQLAFIRHIEAHGYRVTAKEVKFIKTGDTVLPKGNLDVELALDAFRYKDSYDTLLLFSGDSDFAYLLDLLKQDGKRVLVASTRGHIAKELLNRAKYIELRKLRFFIEKSKGPVTRPLEV